MKNIQRKISLWAGLAALMLCVIFGVVFFADATPLDLQPFFKDDYPQDDSVSPGLTPNVLFMLDTGAVMSFAPWGVLESLGGGSTSSQDRVNRVEHSTFGSGARPLMISLAAAAADADGPSGWQLEQFSTEQMKFFDGAWQIFDTTAADGATALSGYNRFGRDLSKENNIIGDPTCYHMPNPKKPYLLTFRHRILAHHDWSGDKPPSFNVSDSIYSVALSKQIYTNITSGYPASNITPLSNELAAAKAAYLAIKDYMPSGDIPGWKISKEDANKYLVPNDSRMYMLKLALWQLTDSANDEKFSKINLAMAQTYKEIQGTQRQSTVVKGVGVVYSKDTVTGSADWRYAVPSDRDYFGSWYLRTTGLSVSSHYGGGSSFIMGIPLTSYNNYTVANNHSYGYIYDASGDRSSSNNATNSTNQHHMGQVARYDVWDWDEGRNPNSNAIAQKYSRALLMIPFDRLYRKDRVDESKFDPTPHRARLREYIDGIEMFTSNTTSINQKPLNEEFFPTGVNFLAISLYGGRSADTIPKGTNVSGITYHYGKTATINSGASTYLIRYADSTTIGTRGNNADGINYNHTSNTNAGKLYLNTIDISDDVKQENNVLKSGQAAGSVIDFFSPISGDGTANGLNFDSTTAGFFPVTGSCQQNWVVLFTSGNDALANYGDGYTTAQGAFNLFQNTLIMRGRELSPDWRPKEYAMDSGVRTIVVGIVDETSPGVGTMVDNIKDIAQHGNPRLISEDANPRIPANWVKNPEAKYYLVKDVEDLTDALNDILKMISTSDMGGGAPVSMPEMETENPDGSRVLLGASYKMNSFNQWNAWLSKQIISKDKASGDIKWEADAKMRLKGLTRDLFAYIGTAPKKITATDLSIAGVPTTSQGSFDKWLHEFDLSDPPQDGSIGILGDMQRSNILVVGAPKANALSSYRVSSNDYAVYAQTNRGVLHSINYITGEENWGFIPPNIFEGRLKRLKLTASGDWIGDRARSSPMLLLDGKLIAEDVKIDSSTYKTILIGHLGRGGNGFYAMDITKSEATPQFLWAIENKYYARDGEIIGTPNVEPWPTTPSPGDYSKLGLTIVPGVIILPKGHSDESVGILPGGLGHKMGSDDQGKALYVFNPVTGGILSPSPFTFEGGGMGVTPITYQTESMPLEKKLKYTVSFYTADSKGHIYSCDTTKLLADWKLKSLFQLTGVSSDSGTGIAIPHGMTTARSEKFHHWIFGGTADIAGPYSTREGNANKIINPQQFIFGVNTTKIGKDKTTGDLTKVLYYADDIKLTYNEGAYNYVSGDLVKHDTEGWYIKLRPKVSPDVTYPQGTEAEYVSAAPYMFNGYLFVATFIPYEGVDFDLACTNIGIGKLYALAPTTGLSAFEKKSALVFENVKIVGFSGTTAKNPDGSSAARLAMSVQALKGGALLEAVKSFTKETLGDKGLVLTDPITHEKSGIVELTVPAMPAIIPNLPLNKPIIQYWREKFN